MIEIPVVNNPLCYEARSFTLLLMDIIYSECEIYSDIRYPESYYIDAIEKLKYGFSKINSSVEEWNKFDRFENALSNEKIIIDRLKDIELMISFYELYESECTKHSKIVALLNTLKITVNDNSFIRELLVYGLIKCIQNFDYIRRDRILRHTKHLFDIDLTWVTESSYDWFKELKFQIALP
jgi:hypothetical protein